MAPGRESGKSQAMRVQRLRQFYARRRRLNSVALYGIAYALLPLASATLAIFYTSVLTLKEYGVFGILSVVVTLCGIVLDAGIPQAIMRHYYDIHRDGAAARAYLANIMFGARAVSLALMPFLGVALYFGLRSYSDGAGHLGAYVLLVLGIAFFERSAETLGAVLRALGRAVPYATGRAVWALAQLAAGLILVMGLHLGVTGALLAMLAGRMAGAFTAFVMLRQGLSLGRGHFRWADLRACLAFGLPLLPNRLATWGRAAALRPALAKVAPVAQIGLYSLAASIADLPLLLSYAVDLALTPQYFKQRVAGSQGFAGRVETLATLVIAALAPVWACAILFSPEVIHAVIGHRYDGAAPICAILLCASFVRSQQPFLFRQIQFLKKTWIMPSVLIPAAVLSLTLTVLLALKWGIVMSCWAVVAADVALYIALALSVRAFEPVHHPSALFLGLTATLAALAAWIALDNSAPFDMRHLALKAAAAIALALLCFAVWIWPRRAFIRQLAQG